MESVIVGFMLSVKACQVFGRADFVFWMKTDSPFKKIQLLVDVFLLCLDLICFELSVRSINAECFLSQ